MPYRLYDVYIDSHCLPAHTPSHSPENHSTPSNHLPHYNLSRTTCPAPLSHCIKSFTRWYCKACATRLMTMRRTDLLFRSAPTRSMTRATTSFVGNGFSATRSTSRAVRDQWPNPTKLGAQYLLSNSGFLPPAPTPPAPSRTPRTGTPAPPRSSPASTPPGPAPASPPAPPPRPR